MRIYKYTLPAGASETIHSVGRYIRGLGAPSRYEIQVDDGAATPFETGIGAEFNQEFKTVRITNTSDEAQTIEVVISMAPVSDNRLVGRMDLNGAIGILATAAQSAVVHPKQSISVSTDVLPFNELRRSAVVQCSGPVHVGNAVDGVELTAFTWEAKTALTLVPKSGTVEVRILEEVNE